MRNSVTIEELMSLFELVIQKLKSADLDNIQFAIDEYWVVSGDEWGKFNEVPAPVVGSLREDILYLQRAIKEGQMISYTDFDRLASVLKAISEIQAPTE